jgi:acyl-CoA synthetase (AMP-forming)/AMP-acid ligase II
VTPAKSVSPKTARPETVVRVLDAPLAERPDATAVVARSGSLTYAQLDAQADAAAGALWELGVRPGDRVAGCLPNDLDVVLAFHGSQRIGAIWAGIGEALSAPEQLQLVDICEPTLVLAGPAWKAEGVRAVDVEQWRAAVAAGHAAPSVDIDPFAPAGIGFTSGTTGTPKALVHSQHNMLLPGAALVHSRGWGPDLRKGDSLALTILNMLILTTLTTAQAQGCSVIIDARHVEGIVEWLVRERVTVWNGVPAQLFDLARRPDLDLSGLREVWSGGGDCPEHLRTAFQDVHGLPIRVAYGLSEAPTIVSIDPVGSQMRQGSCGPVTPQFEVTSCDRDGRPLPPGEIGELVLAPARSGPFAGAWRPYLGTWSAGRLHPNEETTTRTGDIGWVSEDGWLSMVDREKLVIVRGGANVYPAEVERVLTEHPAVRAAVVIGVPDDRLGERVAALIESEADLDTEELRAFCGTQLARYKIPEVWGRVGALPRNAMGKVNRAGLSELLGS